MSKQNCPMCKGQGNFDVWGRPCAANHMHAKMACPLCQGVCFVMGDYNECGTCKGKGGVSSFGHPCVKTDMHFTKDCHMCNGAGWTKVAGGCYPPVPGMPNADFSSDWVNVTVRPSEPNPVQPNPVPHNPYVQPVPHNPYVQPGGQPGGAMPHNPYAPNPSAPPAMPMPVPMPAHNPTRAVPTLPVAGSWRNAADLHDVSTITQNGATFTTSNPKHTWSPSEGVLSGNALSWMSGGLSPFTATVNPEHNCITFSNGGVWVRMT
eukprot:TRINITY_DN1327_c2_g3_i1.p1 TRINITY_DN1327_c2_g3~~TRINITY_DN1327_c2_g3_i1.p1  ORF type:complete len:278 (+),score=42.86 TRINITY_DN1327_c2_g3_i1:48-836(+)